MRITVMLLLVATFQVSAKTYSQSVTINMRNVPLIKVMEEIEKQTGYSFIYEKSLLNKTSNVDVNISNTQLTAALHSIFKEQPMGYTISKKFIVLSPLYKIAIAQGNPPPQPLPQVKGKVIDENGKPIAGATIINKGSMIGTSSDKQGDFRVALAKPDVILVISFVGYGTREINVHDGDYITVKMQQVTSTLSDVSIGVSTGMFSRKKETFTGATATYTGDQLKVIGNQNVLQSLRTLDPSFLILENNLAGSNPNVMPTIEIRGQTSLPANNLKDEFNNDPNQPLFVLDGFVTSLTVINNLDMNRVASITVLKDAASTALYGAKAANGVVVIETKKPKIGKVRFSYTGDFNVQMPDLTGYNMMNASEELQFEKLAGRYTYYFGSSYPIQYYLDSLYNVHLAAVQKGVNTYWLNEPVQTGFTNGHSIYAEGGDETLRYGVGGSYKNITGVMKGSGRKMYSGSIDLAYRKNKLNVANKFYINGYSADGSPYGTFQSFVNAPAYFPKVDSNGIAQRYLEVSRNYYNNELKIYNPLYNATLPNTDNEKGLGFTNNLQIIYTLNASLQLTGGISLNQNMVTYTDFTSPDNTRFEDSSIFTKGLYTSKRATSFGYQGNLGLTYGHVFNLAHQLTGNFRAELEESNNNALSFSAVGFPSGSNGNPAFSFSYQNNARPSSATSKYRRNNLVASVNYVYNRKYFVDATFRVDGSTSFGSNKKYTSFWSAGAGWNLHNEKIFSQYKWINTLRLRANMGTTGNQSMGNITSVSTYNYDPYINLFGQGVSQATMANPNLKWQVTTQTNLGVDMTILNSKISLTGNVYSKITDPMIVVVDLPSSTGLTSYPLNAGKLNTKGMDVSLRYTVINNVHKRLIWSVSGTAGMLKSRYEGFNNTLDALNKQNQLNKSMIRYTDGYSASDLWAVPSAGIDPSTGREVYIAPDGSYTFTYNANNVVRVGNSQPTIQGVFGTYLAFKGFTFSASIRYSYGADVLNTALFNKVENISYNSIGNNQDRRALYERWKKPGDVSQFKSIVLVNAQNANATPLSSRFVQQENYISGESFSLGYDFYGQRWLKYVGMESLRFTAYANDIFRISTIKRERGTDYPFANTVSFSVSTAF